ncbi:MAG: TlpA family protein disulfide reductase [Desulfopila sp.]
MPNFTLENVRDGGDVNSRAFEGKALFITFFATWCPPCIQEVPNLIELQKKYSEEGFSVIGLSVDQGGAKVVRKLVRRKSINYPLAMADAGVMKEFGGIFGIPVAFLVNKNGNVVKKYSGYVPISVLKKDLEKVL